MKIIDEFDFDIDSEVINIVPMIDIIFAILTFFIITSLDLIRIDNIPGNLPKASTSELVQEKPLVLTIDKEDNIFLGNNLIDSTTVVDQIKDFVSTTSNDLLVISADKEVSYGKVIEILDKIRSIENLRIGISTEK